MAKRKQKLEKYIDGEYELEEEKEALLLILERYKEHLQSLKDRVEVGEGIIKETEKRIKEIERKLAIEQILA